ncbi:MAG: hypothetical protein JSS75_07825 [Bacteroidetes bacterium]|nr:hypothetical protein [Bacteroidota bacterium]
MNRPELRCLDSTTESKRASFVRRILAEANHFHSGSIRYVVERKAPYESKPRLYECEMRYTHDANSGKISFLHESATVRSLYSRDTLFAYFKKRGILIYRPGRITDPEREITALWWRFAYGFPGWRNGLPSENELIESGQVQLVGSDTCIRFCNPVRHNQVGANDLLDSSQTQLLISRLDPSHSLYEEIYWHPADSELFRMSGTGGNYSTSPDPEIATEIDSMIDAYRHSPEIRFCSEDDYAQIDKQLHEPTKEHRLQIGDTIPLLDILTGPDQKPLNKSPLASARVSIIEVYHNACQPCMLSLRGISDLRDTLRSYGGDIIGIDPIAEDQANKPLNQRIDRILGRRFKTFNTRGVLFDKSFDGPFPTFYVLDDMQRIRNIFTGYSKGPTEYMLLNAAKSILRQR